MATANGTKTIVFLVAAVIFGVLAAVLSGWYLTSKKNALLASIAGPESEQMVRVIAPKQDLPKGLRLKSTYFNVDSMPAQYVHPNAVRPEDFKSLVDGRFLTEPLPAGKPLLTNFVDDSFPIDFSDLVKLGRRAITVTVDEVSSIGGHIRPGNFVDIFVIIASSAVGLDTPAAAGAQQVAEQKGPSQFIVPVLQNVRVLATGEAAYDETLDELYRPQPSSGRRYTNLTLDVSPEEAALVATAVDTGDPVALLRNRQDKSFAGFTTVSAFDLVANAARMQQEAALREAAAASGAVINENGDWVMPDGTVVKKEDIVVGANGTVMTRGGKVLGAKGLRMNEDGQYIDENGQVVNPDDIVVQPDGTITTKAALMAKAGYTVNENGDFVDANGNVIKKEDVKVLANGTVMAADGTVISGPKVTRTKDGFLVDENGNVMAADGTVLT
ncbi:MAG: Flp pilus assembly protein CpaB, partial [Phycisphaerales bacterium]|nr:Flp pilus assembly protein CpaB [Phycisphaerales bacterium]